LRVRHQESNGMEELAVGPGLIGAQVQNASRPGWGVGHVLRVQAARVDDKPAWRVSIQFAIGHRMLLVPPARLVAPQAEPQRESGWLAGLGKRTLDDRLRALPEQVTQVLGTPLERFVVVIPLYGLSEDNASLLRWASSQTGVSDPLSHWTRDELLAALRDFCNERDAHLRNVAAAIKRTQDPEALQQALATTPEPVRQAVRAVLQRAI
jgi:hypothetical protein